MKSIIQEDKACYICNKKTNLHLHHILFGKNRKKADEDGLVVYLCYEHHEGTNGVHGKNGADIDKYLKRVAEVCWLNKNMKVEEDFIERYGRNYL